MFIELARAQSEWEQLMADLHKLSLVIDKGNGAYSHQQQAAIFQVYLAHRWLSQGDYER
jgi:hypothetical protein